MSTKKIPVSYPTNRSIKIDKALTPDQIETLDNEGFFDCHEVEYILIDNESNEVCGYRRRGESFDRNIGGEL